MDNPPYERHSAWSAPLFWSLEWGCSWCEAWGCQGLLPAPGWEQGKTPGGVSSTAGKEAHQGWKHSDASNYHLGREAGPSNQGPPLKDFGEFLSACFFL